LAVVPNEHGSRFLTEASMHSPYDMLCKDLNGSFIWLEAATDLALARARLCDLASCVPSDYVLFDRVKQETIERISPAAKQRSPHDDSA
jgi:hypothetical protein